MFIFVFFITVFNTLSAFVKQSLPLLFLPLGFSLILLVFGLIGRFRWPVILSVSLLWFFSLGLVSHSLWRWLESPWQRRSALSAPQAHAIVVLSSGRHPAKGQDRVVEWHEPDRFLAGLDLFRAGKADRLLFTGGASPFLPGQPPEGQLYIKEAQRFGIPAASMASTPPVLNTAQEALAISRLLSPLPASPSAIPKRILLVTSAFHMNRAKKLFERQGLHVLPFPVDFQARGRWAGPFWYDASQWFPSAHALDASSRALREFLGRLLYRSW